MSYTHPILVPGAKGHDDPEALREVIERLSAFEPRKLYADLRLVDGGLSDIHALNDEPEMCDQLDETGHVLDRCIDVVRRLL